LWDPTKGKKGSWCSSNINATGGNISTSGAAAMIPDSNYRAADLPSASPLVKFWLCSANSNYLRMQIVAITVLASIASCWYAKVLFSFLIFGKTEVERRHKTLSKLDSLVPLATEIGHRRRNFGKGEETLNATPARSLLDISRPKNVRTYIDLRNVLLKIGQVYAWRIQTAAGFCAVVIVGALLSSVLQLTQRGRAYANPHVTVLFSLLIVVIIAGSIIAQMIIEGGNTNKAAYFSSQMLLRQQMRFRQVANAMRDVISSKGAAVNFVHLRNLLKSKVHKHDVRPSLMVPSKGRIHQLDEAAVTCESVRQYIIEQNEVEPITVFGLRAGPALLNTLGTVVVSGASFGVQNIASAFSQP